MNVVKLNDNIFKSPIILAKPEAKFEKVSKKEEYTDFSIDNYFFPGKRTPVEKRNDHKLLKRRSYRLVLMKKASRKPKREANIYNEAFEIFSKVPIINKEKLLKVGKNVK